MFCAREDFQDIRSAIDEDKLESIAFSDPDDGIDKIVGVDQLLIGTGVSREMQMNAILRRNRSGLETMLYAPEFKHLTDSQGSQLQSLRVIPISGAPAHTRSHRVQRIIDLLISFAASLFILAPLIVILGLIITLTSRGGVLFSTPIVGQRGQIFVWRKFRSMRPPREGDDERRIEIVREAIRHGEAELQVDSTKVVDESRITWIGKIIRKTSLDELPQLINVMQGSMSLVGPRPCLPYEYDEYSEWQRERLNFKPGITGVWQVYGRSRVRFDEMVFMDVCGSLNRSIFGDLKLLLLTVPVALLGRGAE